MSFKIFGLFSFSLFSPGIDFDGLEDDNDEGMFMVLVVALPFELLFIMVTIDICSLKVYTG